MEIWKDEKWCFICFYFHTQSNKIVSILLQEKIWYVFAIGTTLKNTEKLSLSILQNFLGTVLWIHFSSWESNLTVTYVGHYNPRFVYFLHHFHCSLYCRAISVLYKARKFFNFWENSQSIMKSSIFYTN